MTTQPPAAPGVEIRKFSNAKLQEACDRVLAAAPAGTAGAVVAHADLEGASLSVFGRVGDHWTLVAAAYKPYHGELSAEAEMRFTW